MVQKRKLFEEPIANALLIVGAFFYYKGINNWSLDSQGNYIGGDWNRSRT